MEKQSLPQHKKKKSTLTRQAKHEKQKPDCDKLSQS